MKVYLNLITGKEVVAKSLHHITGNIVHRGLSHEYIELDMCKLEYGRLVSQLRKMLAKDIDHVGIRNTIKAIQFFKEHS